MTFYGLQAWGIMLIAGLLFSMAYSKSFGHLKAGWLPASMITYVILRCAWVALNPYVKGPATSYLMLGALETWILVFSGIAMSPQLLSAVGLFIELVLGAEIITLWMGKWSLFTGGTFGTAIMAAWLFPILSGSKGSWNGTPLARYILVRRWVLVPAIIVTIAFKGEGTALFALIAGVVTMGILEKKFRWVLALPPIAIIGLYITGQLGAYIHSDLRLFMWANYMDFWLTQKSYWFGLGPKSFEVFGPFIDLTQETHRYLWMHNDWLEILFEYGIIGLLLAFGGVIHFFRTYEAAYERAFLAAWCVVMLFYSPMQFALFQIFAVRVLCAGQKR